MAPNRDDKRFADYLGWFKQLFEDLAVEKCAGCCNKVATGRPTVQLRLSPSMFRPSLEVEVGAGTKGVEGGEGAVVIDTSVPYLTLGTYRFFFLLSSFLNDAIGVSLRCSGLQRPYY